MLQPHYSNEKLFEIANESYQNMVLYCETLELPREALLRGSRQASFEIFQRRVPRWQNHWESLRGQVPVNLQ